MEQQVLQVVLGPMEQLAALALMEQQVLQVVLAQKVQLVQLAQQGL
jgi:hypothetical protein